VVRRTAFGRHSASVPFKKALAKPVARGSMKIELSEIVSDSFKPLTEKYGLYQRSEILDGPTYSIEYVFNNFIVRLEKYRVEIYATLYKEDNPDEQIDLFNLLAYLTRPQSNAPVGEYFHNETNNEERFRKQLTHIAMVIDQYFAEIDGFFRFGGYASKVADVREFVINKYPWLFKRADS
jgi:hypothetical protein